MSKVTLNLFPARVPIGEDANGVKIYATPEFSRALSSAMERIGGPINMSVDDLALLVSTVTQPDQVARRAAADALAAPAVDQSAMIAALIGKIAALQAQVSQVDGVRAELATLRKRVEGTELQVGYRDSFRVDWGRPGQIGAKKAAAATFTTLTATGAFGCNGKTAQASYPLGAAATDLASVLDLANNLRTMAINNGTGT